MNPELIFFIISSLIRVGTATRDALEQSARDKDFQISVAYPVASVRDRFDEFFNRNTGLRRDLTRKPDGPLAKYWIDNATGGAPDTTADSYTVLFSALGGLKRPDFAANASWISLRTVDEEALVGILSQWSNADKPLDPWARVALAVADVGLGYVGSNPGIVSGGSSGEVLLRALCANLSHLVDDIQDGIQAYFLERLAASIMQVGLQTLSENADVLLTDKSSQDLLNAVAKPLATLFSQAVKAKDPATQLTLSNFRDTIFPQMVSAGLKAISDNQKDLLGSDFDPTRSLGALTQGFLQALSLQSVSALAQGDPKAWLPIYQSLLKSVAANANLIVPGTTLDDKLFKNLILGIATTLSAAPLPYRSDTAINLGLIVVDALQQNLPIRTQDPWILLVPSALNAVVQGLKNTSVPISALAQDELSIVIRAVLAQVATTPGMITGNKSSTELQAIVSSIACAMAEDNRFLISEDGWAEIAAVAASAAAKDPGKLFNINDATPDGQLASKLISKVLASAATSLGSTRRPNVVLFGNTLVGAIKDTLIAAAGNAIGATTHINQITALIDQLNKLVADPQKTIGSADWSWLYRSLIAEAFGKGALNLTDEQLRQMLFDHKFPGA
jgi:hypothetical protein